MDGASIARKVWRIRDIVEKGTGGDGTGGDGTGGDGTGGDGTGGYVQAFRTSLHPTPTPLLPLPLSRCLLLSHLHLSAPLQRLRKLNGSL